MTRARAKEITANIARSKDYESVADIVGSWTGEEEFAKIVEAIEARRNRRPPHQLFSNVSSVSVEELASPSTAVTSEVSEKENLEEEDPESPHAYSYKTPPTSRGPPESALLRAPLSAVNDLRVPIPAFISGRDDGTPTPTPARIASP